MRTIAVVKKAGKKRSTRASAGKKAKKAKKKTAKKAVKKTAKKSAAARKKVVKKAAKKTVKKAAKKKAGKAVKKVKKLKKVKKVKKTRRARKASRKSPLSKAELRKFSELLLTKRRDLLGDLTGIEAEALRRDRSNVSSDLSTLPTHPADVGSDNYEQEFTLGLLESERSLLKEIDEALVRIDENTYGLCLGTGQPIGKPRLTARPWARYCIDYARQIEKGLVNPEEDERRNEEAQNDEDEDYEYVDDDSDDYEYEEDDSYDSEDDDD